MKSICFSLILTIVSGYLFGQMPSCGMVYYHSPNTVIRHYNPDLPISTSNPVTNSIFFPTIPIPTGGNIHGGGLTISPLLGSQSPKLIFYHVWKDTIHYYDGLNWVSTGHYAGHPGARNLGAGGGISLLVTRASTTERNWSGISI